MKYLFIVITYDQNIYSIHWFEEKATIFSNVPLEKCLQTM